ncbi:MAG: hypothetical protein Q9225_007055 [Loekoesia sp. 1 TL-2023]
MNVHVASFFSRHRPISVTNSFPPAFSEAAFASIFEPKPSSKIQPADVIHTVSSAIDSLENAAFQDQITESEISYPSSRASRRLNARTIKHLDGDDTKVEHFSLDIGELSKPFRHFVPPPPPVPLSDSSPKSTSSSKRRSLSAPVKERTYSTTLTITEFTLPNGQKTYQASVSPIRSISSRPATRRITSSPPPSQPLNPNEVTMIEITPPPSSSSPSPPRQPFLERMRKRQKVWEEGLTGKKREIWHSISVKRQRKLKMKKHKYKKLMRKTRNLRRRLDRN